jgi:hypothetical protein
MRKVLRINAAQVRTFLQIARSTGQRQIVWGIWASMVELGPRTGSRRLLEGLPSLGLPVGQKIADIDVGFQFCSFRLRPGAG